MNTLPEFTNFGIGTDIESIDRFGDYSQDSRFLKKLFTKDELDYCFSKKKAASHLAARYAGKEAIVKALTSIGKNNPNYKEIEILNSKKGVPTVSINNANFHDLQVHLSLSHCRDKVVAFTIVLDVDHNEES